MNAQDKFAMEDRVARDIDELMHKAVELTWSKHRPGLYTAQDEPVDGAYRYYLVERIGESNEPWSVITVVVPEAAPLYEYIGHGLRGSMYEWTRTAKAGMASCQRTTNLVAGVDRLVGDPRGW